MTALNDKIAIPDSSMLGSGHSETMIDGLKSSLTQEPNCPPFLDGCLSPRARRHRYHDARSGAPM
jgi:hypothetical protein